MAEYLGESDVAREYREVFERGKAWVDRNLFNGEYYHHIVDLNDSGIPEKFDAWYYWSAEHNEIKYQIGEGCIIDQVLPQWHANLYGLGEIYDPAQTRTALHSLMRANFKNPIRDSYNPFRLYCIADEAGLVICAWPEGRRKPMIPICYAQETMHGYEYSAAILMIQTGMVDEGMRVVKAVRDRYDGERRNPWNEIECGSNYARSMASYALLNAFSGFQFNMVAGHVSFQPIAMVDGRFRCFWSVAAAWGEIVFESGTAQLIVHGGEITLRSIGLPFAASTATIGNAAVPLVQEGDRIVFGDEITVRPGRPLSVAEKPS